MARTILPFMVIMRMIVTTTLLLPLVSSCEEKTMINSLYDEDEIRLRQCIQECPTGTSDNRTDADTPRITCHPMCLKGEYLNLSNNNEIVNTSSYGVCEKCPPNTYMDMPYHTSQECWPCHTTINDTTTLFVESCNSTQQAVTTCRPGYFKKGDICTECKTCQYYNRMCAVANDAICCTVTVDGHYICQHEICPHYHCEHDICRPGFYMVPRDIENNPHVVICRRCRPDKPTHFDYYKSRLIVNCNNSSTTPPQFGCQIGHYRAARDAADLEISCQKCAEPCPQTCAIKSNCSDYNNVECYCPNSDKQTQTNCAGGTVAVVCGILLFFFPFWIILLMM